MRKLTQAEAESFDGCEDHRNTGCDQHCCPYCYESSDVRCRDGSYDDPDVVKCPTCDREFIAWTISAPVLCSAKLPEAEAA